jgi:hypothetical protein
VWLFFSFHFLYFFQYISFIYFFFYSIFLSYLLVGGLLYIGYMVSAWCDWTQELAAHIHARGLDEFIIRKKSA